MRLENQSCMNITGGRFAEVLEVRYDLLSLYQDLGNRLRISRAYAELGEAYQMMGDYENARIYGRKALAVTHTTSLSYEEAFGRWMLGLTLLALEEYDEAESMFYRSKAVHHGISSGAGVSVALAGLARLDLALGRPQQAWQRIITALQSFSGEKHMFWLLYVLAVLSLLFAEEGEPERAVELWAMISTQPFVSRSRWFEELFGAHIQAAAATLPPETLTAAQSRAAALDIWETSQALIDEFCI
jgi:tetratricopeptide (TPR) repeat protein